MFFVYFFVCLCVVIVFCWGIVVCLGFLGFFKFNIFNFVWVFFCGGSFLYVLYITEDCYSYGIHLTLRCWSEQTLELIFIFLIAYHMLRENSVTQLFICR